MLYLYSGNVELSNRTHCVSSHQSSKKQFCKTVSLNPHHNSYLSRLARSETIRVCGCLKPIVTIS